MTAATLISGCIAGAGLDSNRRKEDARSFPTRIDPGTTVIRESVSYGLFEQVVPIRLERFARHEMIPISEERTVDDILVRYSQRRIVIQDQEGVVVDQTLPGAFDSHPLFVALETIAHREVVVLVTDTRSSTGMMYVGIYESDGRCFYEATLTSGEVWDVQRSNRGILILGADSKIEIVIPSR
jgi:hypothetical protein